MRVERKENDIEELELELEDEELEWEGKGEFGRSWEMKEEEGVVTGVNVEEEDSVEDLVSALRAFGALAEAGVAC